MGYYTYTLLERYADGGACWLVKADFTPRKIDPERVAQFQEMLTHISDDPQSKAAWENTQAELKEKLHNGRGDLSLQEWDDFLADIVEMGLITNDERMYANGVFNEVPEANLHTGYAFSSPGDPEEEFDQLWMGDPLQWLNDRDLYMLKYGLYYNMSGGYVNVSAQRAACNKVIELLKDILDK